MYLIFLNDKKKKKSHKKNQVNEEVLEAGNHSADAVPTLF